MHKQSGKRITIFTGHYGSGKTEIAVNYVLQCRESAFKDTCIVDLDFVNPYFRSRETRDKLKEHGITVIASAEDCFNTDLPALSPKIPGVLKNETTRVVVDLGGDDTGARAIGRFRNNIADDQYEMCFVVNPFRPFTSNVREVASVLADIEKTSRLKVTSLVSNPNLLRETTKCDIIEGHRKITEWAGELGYSIKFLAVEHQFYDQPEVKNMNVPVLKLERSMLVPWE